MKLYLIDWGSNTNGGRFAITEAEDPFMLWLQLDEIGDPSSAKAVEINNGEDGDFLYVELEEPSKAYANHFNERIPWEDYPETDEDDNEPPLLFDKKNKQWFKVKDNNPCLEYNPV